jgi:hypothetical protein
MTPYEKLALEELTRWRKAMQRRPSIVNRLSKNLQTKINQAIPEKIHMVITTAIKQMTRAVCAGSEFTSKKPLENLDLQRREVKVLDRIRFFSKTAAAEGAITGAGGILLGLADFPLWLTLKMKMLFEIASIYGYDVKKYQERLFILHVFELTFSSQKNRNTVFKVIDDWESYAQTLPGDMNEFDWRVFQQEYRDFIDIAKLLQLVPGIGAPVGAYVNHRLTTKLGMNAMNAYRLRLEQDKQNRRAIETRRITNNKKNKNQGAVL